MTIFETPSRWSTPRPIHPGRRGSLLLALVSLAPLSGWPSQPMAEGPQEGVFYEWTDSEGRTHFSDQAPTEHVGRVERRALPAMKTPPPDLDTDYYSVENQARRLEESRQERAAARREAAAIRHQERLREAQLEAARAQRDAARATQEAAERPAPCCGVPYYWPAYPPPLHRPKPIRRPFHPPQELERRVPRLSLPPGVLERR
jgi:hypothetical protein